MSQAQEKTRKKRSKRVPSESQQQLQQPQQTQQPQQQESGGKNSKMPGIRLDLNLDVEITLKARVHGDVTLAILS
ncbi:hypothetical protein G6F56_008297 [Rhizopus delemar]|nr:hypothetical protein G6F56_008297 [Rhizopus delemar]